MKDQQLISELEQVAKQETGAEAGRAHLIQEIKQRAAEYQQANQHWRGVSLLGRAREVIAPMTDLDRTTALVLGVVSPNRRKFRQAISDNISGSNGIESTT